MATITIGRELDAATDSVTADQGAAGAVAWPVRDAAQLVPFEFDHVGLSYTSGKLTGVEYRLGGAGGAIVATLALGYSGGRLVTVSRS